MVRSQDQPAHVADEAVKAVAIIADLPYSLDDRFLHIVGCDADRPLPAPAGLLAALLERLASTSPPIAP